MSQIVIENSKYLDAQNAVLGSALIEPSLAGKLVFELSPEEFQPPLRAVFQAFEDLYSDGRPIDAVTVASRCGNEYIPTLKQLMEITPTAAHFDQYVQIVRTESRMRKLRAIGEALQEVQSSNEAEDLVAQANALMVSRPDIRGWTMAELLLDFERRQEQPPEFLVWPIQGLQDVLMTKKGHFVFLAAEPSTGKTALAIQCALEWAKTKRVGFFSLETGEEDMEERIVSTSCDISYTAIQKHKISDEGWEIYTEKAEELTRRNIRVFPCARISIDDIKHKTLENNFDVVIIDYIQLVQAPKGSSIYEEMSKLSMAAHIMAKETRTTVIALAQVTRASLANGSPLTMHDIKGTGQWEQDADGILLLGLMEAENTSGLRYLKIGKNKGGPKGIAYLGFKGDRQTFYKVSADEANEWLSERKKKSQRN